MKKPQLDSSAFEKWWEEAGQYYDPDSSDVPWFDKRKELAREAFNAAVIHCTNKEQSK